MIPLQPPDATSYDDLLNPRRQEELKTATAAAESRLRALGIALTGEESSDELVELIDAIERFEQAVVSHGGDLMVDEPPPGEDAQPDDPEFALPQRRAGESVRGFVDRVDASTGRIQQRAE